MKTLRFGLVLVFVILVAALVPAAAAAPMLDTNQWSGEYFNNTTLSGDPVLRRGDAEINFSWAAYASPGPGVAGSGYSVRWTRDVYFGTTGNWIFTTVNDDGMRVWVDNRITTDWWFDQGPTLHTGKIHLTAGTHTVRVEYYNRVMGGTARVSWALEGSVSEWRGEYFSNPNLEGSATLTRNDANINFDWGNGSPDAAIPADRFSVRWTRTLYLNAGTWRFTTTADDGVRLWVDSTLLIDQWYDQSATSHSADIGLAAGDHTIRMEYYDSRVSAEARLSYTPVNATPPATGVWRGQYFDNISLSGSPVMVRDDASLHFIWNNDSPGPGVPANYFSAKWDSTQVLPITGNYTILVSSDDGVRVWIDGALVIDAWYDHSAALFSATRWLAAGAHNVHVEYYDRTVNALVGVDITPVAAPAPPPPAYRTEVVVDNKAAGWQAGGAADHWRNTWNGVGGHAFWTESSSYAVPLYNWARWYPTLTGAGYYEVFAYIPGGVATTTNARYWIYHNRRYDLAPRAQAYRPNQWMSLGTYYFNATGGEFVSLSEVTNNDAQSEVLVFDAVKFSPR